MKTLLLVAVAVAGFAGFAQAETVVVTHRHHYHHHYYHHYHHPYHHRHVTVVHEG